MLDVKHGRKLYRQLNFSKMRRLPFTDSSDITYSTMDKRKLQKLSDELESMRKSPQKAANLESLAMRLGRSVRSRGKHPMWLSDVFPLPALSIPHHKGDVPKGTCNCILDVLEDDILAWETHLGEGK